MYVCYSVPIPAHMTMYSVIGLDVMEYLLDSNVMILQVQRLSCRGDSAISRRIHTGTSANPKTILPHLAGMMLLKACHIALFDGDHVRMVF
jgi:hypothetical protein